jgi:hypothetical protein
MKTWLLLLCLESLPALAVEPVRKYEGYFPFEGTRYTASFTLAPPPAIAADTVEKELVCEDSYQDERVPCQSWRCHAHFHFTLPVPFELSRAEKSVLRESVPAQIYVDHEQSDCANPSVELSGDSVTNASLTVFLEGIPLVPGKTTATISVPARATLARAADGRSFELRGFTPNERGLSVNFAHPFITLDDDRGTLGPVPAR